MAATRFADRYGSGTGARDTGSRSAHGEITAIPPGGGAFGAHDREPGGDQLLAPPSLPFIGSHAPPRTPHDTGIVVVGGHRAIIASRWAYHVSRSRREACVPEGRYRLPPG